MAERMGNDSAGVPTTPVRPPRGHGAQVGALTGNSQRVLGQHDLALLDSTVAPRLPLPPHLSQAARSLELDRDELVLWVTIHEITHASSSGAPWLRDHLGG
jgi:uncharacterized protein (DUF2342 family)